MAKWCHATPWPGGRRDGVLVFRLAYPYTIAAAPSYQSGWTFGVRPAALARAWTVCSVDCLVSDRCHLEYRDVLSLSIQALEQSPPSAEIAQRGADRCSLLGATRLLTQLPGRGDSEDGRRLCLLGLPSKRGSFHSPIAHVSRRWQPVFPSRSALAEAVSGCVAEERGFAGGRAQGLVRWMMARTLGPLWLALSSLGSAVLCCAGLGWLL